MPADQNILNNKNPTKQTNKKHNKTQEQNI